MSENLHPSQLQSYLIAYFRARYGFWLSVAVAIALFSSGVGSRKHRPLLMGSSLVMLAVSGIQRKQYRDIQRYLTDIQEVSEFNFRNYLKTQTSPQSPMVVTVPAIDASWEPTLFNWELFNTQSDRFPHLALVADSGGGKSTTGLWLTTWLQGKHYAILPHKKPGDYHGIPSFCGGRNYGNKEDPRYPLMDILDGKYQRISVVTFLKSLYEEFDHRYKLYEQGIEDYPLLNIHWDEYNAFVRKVRDKDLISKIEDLVAEARKVKIRIIFFVQSDNCEDMEINSKLQKSIKFISLSDFATQKAKKVDKTGKLSNWMEVLLDKGNDFPVLVQDTAATVPHKKYWGLSTTNEQVVDKSENDSSKPDNELNEYELLIVETAHKLQGDILKARYLQQNCRAFKNWSAEDIRTLFKSLSDRNYGEVTGEADRLSFKIKSD
ncbi:MAG: hypothetical protein AAF378_24575 [Cyanobacteria bacterium P01_A01_bin.84]